jgi:protein gp37
MGKTGIPYVDMSWPIVRGCRPVGRDCENCWAPYQAIRAAKPGQAYHGLVVNHGDGPKWTGRARFVESELAKPLRWQKPHRVFVTPYGDLFHRDVTNAQLIDVFSVMMRASHHTFLVFTKRPERLYDAIRRFVATPPPNVQLIVSACDQTTADERLPWLLETPAVVKGVSLEPLLGRVVLPSGLDWVIVGCETGRQDRRRGMSARWVRDIRDQCVHSKVAFYLKQQYFGQQLVEHPRLDGKVWRELP